MFSDYPHLILRGLLINRHTFIVNFPQTNTLSPKFSHSLIPIYFTELKHFCFRLGTLYRRLVVVKSCRDCILKVRTKLMGTMTVDNAVTQSVDILQE